jgi:hypothetical protein
MMFHRILFVLLACGSPLLAQAPAAPTAPAAVLGLQVRGLAFQLDSPPEEVYVHDALGGGKVPGVKLEVKSYLNHESSALPIKSDSLVFAGTADPTVLKDPAKIFAKAKLPAGFRSGIFMFLPGTGIKGEPPFRVLVIGDSRKDFPPGSVKVLNLSPQGVRIQLEKTSYDFKSGESKIIKDPPVAENQTSGMVAFSYSNGEWRRIASGVWPHPGEKRVLQVMFENSATKQVEIRGVRDVAAPQP